MPDLQSPGPDPAANNVAEIIAAVEDPDIAFGCECADPALQIAQWGQEARVGADGP